MLNNFLIIPSIDISGGKTVQVVQGIPELNCAEYGNDPVETAMLWRAENAKIIHVVDFDNSASHSHINFDIIADICDSVIIPVEMGGGISTLEDAEEVFSLGVYRIIIGSLIHDDKKSFSDILSKFGPRKVVAAIDTVDNRVVIHGRKSDANISPVDFAFELKAAGIERIIVTDVKRNGMLAGPNLELTKSIAEATGLQITHSGGISNYEDLIETSKLAERGVDSVIIGRALYENKFPCQKIWRVAESGIIN
ncbi:MAG: 1-(5-phosphoribosyl)-5-[(5-phosphoribosylamino)methylideneamino] imidazole-4-carboxamide isomerase [Chlorobi bacterium]|nr:1-(5-phosphoribosyl)-5-[(5-phosphoribosylamino)methylideneamino] imidazole-4-carboxamide isomerase [Chlorobiota bacterium]